MVLHKLADYIPISQMILKNHKKSTIFSLNYGFFLIFALL